MTTEKFKIKGSVSVMRQSTGGIWYGRVTRGGKLSRVGTTMAKSCLPHGMKNTDGVQIILVHAFAMSPAALRTIMAGHLHDNLVCLGFPTIGSRGVKEKKGWTHSPCHFFYYLGGKIWDVNIKKP